MNENIIIRKLQPCDCDDYNIQLVQYYFESVTMSAYEENYSKLDAEKKISELKMYLEMNQAIVFGAFDDSKLIGFVWAYKFPFREDVNRLYISVVHVDSLYRNQGIGKQFIQSIELEAKKLGIETIFLHAEATNDRACKFYEREGFSKERIQYVRHPQTESTKNKVGGGNRSNTRVCSKK